MKQCPACKTTYTDDSLVFCLSDGTTLISISEPPPTQIMPFDKMCVEIPSGQNYQSDPTIISAPSTETKKSSKGLIYILLTIGVLALLGVVFIAAFLIYNNYKKEVVLNNSTTPSPTPSALPSKSVDNSQELKDRLANLEKQLNDQKNGKPVSTPSQSNSTPGTPTARVSSTSDGFLAMRSEPSTETGAQILKIPTGATVELEDCQRTYSTISGKRGRWCMVSYGGETGWAFDAWLIY